MKSTHPRLQIWTRSDTTRTSSKSGTLILTESLYSPVGVELVANDRDMMLKDPVILKQVSPKRKIETMDDVTDFPE